MPTSCQKKSYLRIAVAGKNAAAMPKMSRFFLITVLLASTLAATAQPTGRDIVKKMHDRYAGKWYRSFTFNQTTEIYRNDSLRSTQTWYEFIRFPERFRMDFGSAD